MLNQSPLITFVATQNADQAHHFYQNSLDLTLVADESFALVFDANGTMLRIWKVQAHTPPPFIVLGWQVTDIQAEIKRLAGRGYGLSNMDGLRRMNMVSGQPTMAQKWPGSKTPMVTCCR